MNLLTFLQVVGNPRVRAYQAVWSSDLRTRSFERRSAAGLDGGQKKGWDTLEGSLAFGH